MGIIRRRSKRPQTLEFGTSFAEGATRSKRRGRRNHAQAAYDMPVRPSQSSHFDHHDPNEPRKRSVGKRIGGLIALLVVFAMMFGIAWFAFTQSQGTDIEPGAAVAITIENGEAAGDIAQKLEDLGVIDNRRIFQARLRLNGDGGAFKAGTYKLKTGSAYDTIVATLEKGPPPAPVYELLLPEGNRIEESAFQIDQKRAATQGGTAKPLPRFTGQEYAAAVKSLKIPAKYQQPKDAANNEGFLFPAKFELLKGASAQEFASKQLETFQANFDDIDLSRAKKANLTAYDIVIIASLIEREAQLDDERATIAAVIWNRLAIGEPLGIDATTQYAVYEPGSKEFWKTELFQSDLAIDSPYNTRTNGGLPPTPIASPGLASLQAAANPADVDFRYYVADPSGSGKHFFTESFDEFLNHPYQNG